MAAGLALLLLQAAAYAQPADSTTALTGAIDEAAPRLMAEHKTPGVSVALVETRQIVWQKSYGVQRAGAADAVEVDTVFEACSMSKPLFAYATMKLVEDGRLELDRPLVEYLGKPYLPDEPRHDTITARMVLEHTSGLPNWRPGGWRARGPMAVAFEPGTKFRYSGEGIWFLQQVVENVIGERMEPWIQRTLLRPLEMAHSSYVWQPQYDEIGAAGHTAAGEVKTGRKTFDRDNAAFSLYTTPTDYARFLIAMMATDRAAPHSLGRASLTAMLTPAVKTDEPDVWRGIGWAIHRSEKGSYINHSGANGTGFRCHSRFDPATGNGIVIMTNALGGVPVWQGIIAAVEPFPSHRQDP